MNLSKHIMSGLVCGVALFAQVAMAAPPFGAGTLAAWVQYTADGVEVRAVVEGDCPWLEIDGTRRPMALRADATSEHANYVCSAVLAKGVKRVSLQGQALPVPVKTPRRIVVVGDTGCRVTDAHGGLYQECYNDSIWPFAQVARAIADYDPDLVIYTGDYIYRESDCPERNAGCVGTPNGDNQATWQADWLDPAQPIHLAAPLLLVRGNHESCSRAGHGWFRYLDARDHPNECVESTLQWSVDFGKFSVGVMDTASLTRDGESLTPWFAAQLRALDKELGKNNWIASHRPFWGYGASDDDGSLTTPTSELQEAVGIAGLPDGTKLLVSAHIHLAQILEFDQGRPPQLVVANGGTQLIPRVDSPESIDGATITEQRVLYQYGFVTMESHGKRWNLSFRDIEGRELENCRLHKKKVNCH